MARGLGKSPRVPDARTCAHLKYRARSGEEVGRPLPAGHPARQHRQADTAYIKDFEAQ